MRASGWLGFCLCFCGYNAYAQLTQHGEIAPKTILAGSIHDATGMVVDSVGAGRFSWQASFDTGDDQYVEVPECAGRGAIAIDGVRYAPLHGSFIVRVPRGHHEMSVAIDVSSYEGRVTCSGPFSLGALTLTRDGFQSIDFASPESLGGHAVLYVPHHHDATAAGPMLVGLHPWNGSMWTYAAITELVREADASDVVLLMPSGLGNSLYTAAPEAEVFRAIHAAETSLAIDPRRVSLWGASMGGAGATTIALHRPDAFASITSFFGDSKYDVATYVRSILPTPEAAHLVNALDIADNARHVPIWLIHGEADSVSPIAQSEMLSRDLSARPGYAVRFDRAPGEGHSGRLVARYASELVKLAAAARSPEHPSRVTFRSVRPQDTQAYGVRLVRAGVGDAAFDVEYNGSVVRLISATNVTMLALSKGALGAPSGARVDVGASRVTVRWE